MDVSLKQKAYDFIRDKLMLGELAAGARLSNRALATEIGISVIPVREAMSQLVSEGLLEHRPKVGVFVVESSREELVELCELREALESYAAAKAASRAEKPELAEMRMRCQTMQLLAESGPKGDWTDSQMDDWRLADAGFHLALLRAAGNRRAMKTVADLRVMTVVFGHRDQSLSLRDPHRAVSEHLAILEAIERGDVDEARRVMSAHLYRSQEIILAIYDRERMAQSAEHTPTAQFSRLLRRRIHSMEALAQDSAGGSASESVPEPVADASPRFVVQKE